MPLISVVIPAYNCAETISETISSVRSQTYPAIETIVVDDGSTDGTSSVLQDHGDTIKTIVQDNRGVSSARNRGLANARGEYVAFLDADDLWEPSKLELQVGHMNEVEWSYTDAYYFGDTSLSGKRRSESSPLAEGHILDSLIRENFITTSSVVARRSALTSIGGFDESVHLLEDWILWLRLAQRYPVVRIDQPLVFYRVSQQAAYRSDPRKSLEAHLHVYRQLRSKLPRQRQTKRAITHGMAKSYTVCSYIAEDRGCYSLSLYCAWKALSTSAISLERWKRFARALIVPLFVLTERR